MIRKSIALILLGVAAGLTAAHAQNAPKPPERPSAPQAFAWTTGIESSGYLGVQTEDVSRENFAKFGLKEVRGVAIEKVMDNSPAAAAGIQAGDVIVRFNGEEITSVRKLTRLISEVAPDHRAKVTVIRGGSERDIEVTIGKRPAPEFAGAVGGAPFGRFELPEMGRLPMPPAAPEGEWREFEFPGGRGRAFTMVRGGRQIGVVVTGLTKQLAEHFKVDGGVMVTEVRENTPAAKAGLKAGDIIVEADGKPVKDDMDVIRAINGKKDGEAVQITFVRAGKRETVSVVPEAAKDGGFNFRMGDRAPMSFVMPRPFVLDRRSSI
ncbi:MAG: PDZ domain-containing protein [Pyrinomonadaceae bacterium]